ncbi:4-phytase, partial [Oscillochloris sp. ZM17-4]|uniref:peptide ABC transporter substrate-binding protein n=1 Tax=Oscillochloris sp. ZM17-4 TaxID=2866714 RepID=UPI0021071237
ETLQLAAVLGPGFAPRLLAALAGPGAPLDARLEALEGAGFLLRDGEGYGFRHILIRESAYGAMLFERRRGHHGAAAAAIERLYPTRLAERSGELAEHYERAEQLGAAARYHGQAADGARLLYANAEAEAGYRHVLALLEKGDGDEGLRARTYLKLAQVQMNAGDYAAAQELYDVAFELLEREESARGPKRDDRHTPMFRMATLEPTSLDPASLDSTIGVDILRNLFEGLVALDDDLNVVPAVARRWRFEEAGRRCIFELQPGLHWSDGCALTAFDFVFAWRRNLEPLTSAGFAERLYFLQGAAAYHQGRSTTFADVGARAIDTHTIEVTLTEPSAYFLSILAYPIAFPQPSHVIARYGAAWSQPDHLVCNGPFTVLAWHREHHLQLGVNRHYHSPQRVGLNQAQLLFLAPSEELAHRKDLDLCRVVAHNNLLQGEESRLITLNYLATYFLIFSVGLASSPSRNTRCALAACIDRDQLVQEVWGGVQQPANGGLVPPGLLGHSPNLGVAFDPARARALLGAAARPRLRMATMIGFGETPAFLQRAWHLHGGLDVEVERDVAGDQLIEGLRDGHYQIALIGWEAEYPDPDNFLRTLFHSASAANYVGWRNPAYDALVERAARATRQAQRAQLYREAERILVLDEVACVPLYYERVYSVLQPSFRLRSESRLIHGGQIRLAQVDLAPQQPSASRAAEIPGW